MSTERSPDHEDPVDWRYSVYRPAPGSPTYEYGHDVTLLNRGKTGPNLFPELKFVRADREQEGFESLSDLRQDWDAVVDLCALLSEAASPFPSCG